MTYRIGVDLGGTNIAAGVVNESFEIVAQGSVPTQAGRPCIEIVRDIAAVCKKVIADAGLTEADIKSVGVASPGTVDDETGIVFRAANLNFFNFPLVPHLREMLSIPEFHLENDANAAAWGEAIVGAAKGSKSSIMITLGTGVGGGVVENGKIHKGFNNAGAEMGHFVIEVDGRPCTCGRKGCWEAYSSATGLINMTKEKLAACEAEDRKTVMTDLVAQKGKVNGRIAFDGMRLGDEAAKEVVNEYIEYLSDALASVITLFQPEVLSIGGGISNEGQFLLDLVVPRVQEALRGNGTACLTDIRIAQLRNNAGIIGAAVLGM
ncbi:MAG: ROK family protein [Ruminococcaceae bacterium]|nr:ROK family protein [Oscillospiraceae bacterium]